MPPAVPTYAGGAMFQRYVSLGNSITSGFQSGGINDSTQKQAYPVLVGAKMGTPFYYPSLALPGCPPPYTNIFTGTRLAGGTSTTCAYRASTPPYVSNLGVPSAQVIDIMHNGPTPGTNSNALTQIILGGRTQIEAMADARPTFVSVWIGNNDVLGSVLSATNAGDSALITPVATFQTRYQEVVDGVKATGAKALLIGVANVTAIPYASQGGTYYAIKAGLVPGVTFPATFHVDAPARPTPSGASATRCSSRSRSAPRCSAPRGGRDRHAALHRAADGAAGGAPQDSDDRRRVQRVHLERGHDERLGLYRSQSDARLTAPGPGAGRPVPEYRRRLLDVTVRPGVLVRRIPSQRIGAPDHCAPRRPRHQREVRLGDPCSLSATPPR